MRKEDVVLGLRGLDRLLIRKLALGSNLCLHLGRMACLTRPHRSWQPCFLSSGSCPTRKQCLSIPRGGQQVSGLALSLYQLRTFQRQRCIMQNTNRVFSSKSRPSLLNQQMIPKTTNEILFGGFFKRKCSTYCVFDQRDLFRPATCPSLFVAVSLTEPCVRQVLCVYYNLSAGSLLFPSSSLSPSQIVGSSICVVPGKINKGSFRS